MNADTPKRKNLGRGLDALFGEQESGTGSETGAVHATTATRLPLDLMEPSPLQPRRHFDETTLNELAASIAQKGVLQPLLVRPAPQQPGRYEIVAGERRWRAAQRANVHEVPVHVTNLTDSEVLEVALIENLQRQDLSPVDEARGYRRLMDEFGHTQERLAEIVGKSRTHVSNMIRILTLPPAVLDLLDSGKISLGQVRPLIGLAEAEVCAQQIIKRGLNARQAERFAKGFGRHKLKGRQGLKDADTAALEESLSKATGYKVSIKFDGVGGAVTIAYTTLEQLDDIVRRLSSGGRAAKPATTGDEAFPADTPVSAADDHTGAYPDPAADDVGAAGGLTRTPH